jgi:hypothetical protein
MASASEPNRESLIDALQGWQIAKERASRANRNLLQYAAGIAAVLGIEAGSGGIFAIAAAVTQPDAGPGLFPTDLLKLLMAVGFALAVILGLMLAGAFQQRRREERTMDQYLATLIAIRPDAFLPKLET